MAVRSPDGDAPQGSATNGDLWQRIQSVYHQALESGALYKTDSSDQFIEDGGVEFVVRVAASLRDKPKPPNRRALPAQASCWQTQSTRTMLRNRGMRCGPLSRGKNMRHQPAGAAHGGQSRNVKTHQIWKDGHIAYYNAA